MAFNRFRPKSHFIAPHSWSNDPCGAVYVPESGEYLFCYQWNPGTTDGGNCAWGMAKSKDLVNWEDCAPAIWNGSTYDSLGVFSGSIVSRLVSGKRVLFLFYTSVSALPIHWSKPYIKGCETQSVAISTDLGLSWHRHEANPLLKLAPKGDETTGWRDPFVSTWPKLSALLNVDADVNYMMLSSGERQKGPQLHIYSSHDLIGWEKNSVILDVKKGSKVSEDSDIFFGINFECACFFSTEDMDYIIMGVEEDESSTRHNGHYLLWLSGSLKLVDGSPSFQISGHGLLDHGVAYAAHLFQDAEGKLLQLGWADETAKKSTVKSQGWAGCLVYPRELFEVTKPFHHEVAKLHEWTVDADRRTMSTLGIRPARQVAALRCKEHTESLRTLESIKSRNFEIAAKFCSLAGQEILTFNVCEDASIGEVTRVVFNMADSQITVDRSQSSLADLGANTPDSGKLHLLPGEDLDVRILVDVSVIEVYANNRFALTSRVYPSSDAAVGVSYDFGDFDEKNVSLECWKEMQEAWPGRKRHADDLVVSRPNHVPDFALAPGIPAAV